MGEPVCSAIPGWNHLGQTDKLRCSLWKGSAARLLLCQDLRKAARVRTNARVKKMDAELLSILVCPETKDPVRMASAALLESVNKTIAEGKLENRGGEVVSKPLVEGLVRSDGAVLYPVRDGIPVMLIDQAIKVAHLT